MYLALVIVAAMILTACGGGGSTEYRGDAWITHSNDRLSEYGLEPIGWADLPKDD